MMKVRKLILPIRTYSTKRDNKFAFKNIKIDKSANVSRNNNVKSNPGIGNRLEMYQEDEMSAGISASHNFEELHEDMDEFESDFMNAGKSHRLHERELSIQKEKLKTKITYSKYLKEVESSFLTFAEKEEIKSLHERDPNEWSVERLSESFPALPATIKKVLRAKWSPKSVETVLRYDDKVISNWEAFRAGELPLNPTMEKHLQNFRDRHIVLTDREELAKRFVPPKMQFPKPKCKVFSRIAETFLLPSRDRKAKTDEENTDVEVIKKAEDESRDFEANDDFYEENHFFKSNKNSDNKNTDFDDSTRNFGKTHVDFKSKRIWAKKNTDFESSRNFDEENVRFKSNRSCDKKNTDFESSSNFDEENERFKSNKKWDSENTDFETSRNFDDQNIRFISNRNWDNKNSDFETNRKLDYKNRSFETNKNAGYKNKNFEENEDTKQVRSLAVHERYRNTEVVSSGEQNQMNLLSQNLNENDYRENNKPLTFDEFLIKNVGRTKDSSDPEDIVLKETYKRHMEKIEFETKSDSFSPKESEIEEVDLNSKSEVSSIERNMSSVSLNEEEGSESRISTRSTRRNKLSNFDQKWQTDLAKREDNEVSLSVVRSGVDTYVKEWIKRGDDVDDDSLFIKIPKHRYKEGMTYRVKNCYYDDDGEFLYKVPGLHN